VTKHKRDLVCTLTDFPTDKMVLTAFL